MKDDIIGRERELNRLDSCMEETQAQLILIYGRRRVGKTFLINNYFDGRFDFKLTGAYKLSMETQLRGFASELRRQTGKDHGVPKDWVEAFEWLRNYIEILSKVEKKVIFFDEMPWMDTARSGFLPAFEWFWNDFGSSVKNLIFVVCGSATAWLKENFEENKGGLFQRTTCRIFLNPFSLNLTEKYLKSRGIEWARYEIAMAYMIVGGIPYYLSLMRKELSLSQNIDELFFRKRAELWDEYDHLYRTLFTNSDDYIKVVETLSKRHYGLTRKEIAGQCELANNGVLTEMLKNMVDSGFIREEKTFNGKIKDTVYALSDYYTLFYFRFIKNALGRDEHFWSHSIDNPAKRAWSGLAFEQLCKDHITEIKKKIGISGVLSEESTWCSKSDDKGAQIDLVIDRRDMTVNLCEIKFSENEVTLDKDMYLNLQNKDAVFQQETKCKKSIQTTLVSTYGAKKGKYSGIINNEVVLDDLFDS